VNLAETKLSQQGRQMVSGGGTSSWTGIYCGAGV